MEPFPVCAITPLRDKSPGRLWDAPEEGPNSRYDWLGVIHLTFRDSGMLWDEWRARFIRNLHEEEVLWDWLGDFQDGKEVERREVMVEEEYAATL